MSGIDRVVLDTNIIIYYLKGHENVAKYFEESHPIISFINELEVLSGAYFFPDELVQIRRFLQEQTIINYFSDIKEIVIRLRATKKLKLPDAITAATALFYEIPLVSADKSFHRIEGLNFIYHEPAIF